MNASVFAQARFRVSKICSQILDMPDHVSTPIAEEGTISFPHTFVFSGSYKHITLPITPPTPITSPTPSLSESNFVDSSSPTPDDSTSLTTLPASSPNLTASRSEEASAQKTTMPPPSTASNSACRSTGTSSTKTGLLVVVAVLGAVLR
jgi:hypothetical protein